MVKKKISGQTIAIIILTVLLLLTIGFGGVFAFYSARSSKISGKIEMANLKINLISGTGDSDKSEIVISNGTNVVPGQTLKNSALTVENLSSVSIYLIVVYDIKAVKKNGTIIGDAYKGALIDIDVEYINSTNQDYNSQRGVVNYQWIDYVFNAEQEGRYYRCLVSTVDFPPTGEDGDPIVVIDENKLSLSGDMGNDYQETGLTFTFQAYAIASATFDSDFNFETSKLERCESIVSKIYYTQGYKFLNV